MNYPAREVTVSIESPLNSALVMSGHSEIADGGETYKEGDTVMIRCEAKVR